MAQADSEAIATGCLVAITFPGRKRRLCRNRVILFHVAMSKRLDWSILFQLTKRVFKTRTGKCDRVNYKNGAEERTCKYWLGSGLVDLLDSVLPLILKDLKLGISILIHYISWKRLKLL